MNPVIVVRPVKITDETLFASSVPENDYPEWNILTSYPTGARVILASKHEIYESSANSNLGNNPATSGQEAWLKVGPTNRWRCLDTSISTQTVQPLAMSFTLRPPHGVNAIAALNIVGGLSVRFRVTHPALGVIFDQTKSLASLPSAPDWWHWHFGLRTAPPLAFTTDLPGIPGCEILIEFTGTVDLAVGVLLVGEQRLIGEGVEEGASASLRNFSVYEENRWGDMVLTQGKFAKDVRMSVPVAMNQVDDVFEYLTSVLSTPCLFIGSKDRRLLTAFGFIQDVPTALEHNTVASIDLYIKAMT